MKNYVQPGRTLDVVLDGTYASGDGFVFGNGFGICATNGINGDTVAVDVEGVFTLPKLAGSAWTQGEKIAWDTATKKATDATTSGNKAIGYAVIAAGSADTTGTVKLVPSLT